MQITIKCKACQAIIVLASPGAFVHTTHLKCIQCGALRTIRMVDSTASKDIRSLVIA